MPKHEECTAYNKHAEKLEKDESSAEKMQLKKEVKNEEWSVVKCSEVKCSLSCAVPMGNVSWILF